MLITASTVKMSKVYGDWSKGLWNIYRPEVYRRKDLLQNVISIIELKFQELLTNLLLFPKMELLKNITIFQLFKIRVLVCSG